MAEIASASATMHQPRLVFFLFVLLLLIRSAGVSCLGSMQTLAAIYSTTGDGAKGKPENSNNITVCAILQGRQQSIHCWQAFDDSSFTVRSADASPLLAISGGKGLLCALQQVTQRSECWSLSDSVSSTMKAVFNKKIFSQVVVGEDTVCGLQEQSPLLPDAGSNSEGSSVFCSNSSSSVAIAVPSNSNFSSLTAGAGFVCGLQAPNGTVECWGSSELQAPTGTTFSTIQAGGSHVCAIIKRDLRSATLSSSGHNNVLCWGSNAEGQLNTPNEELSSLALGRSHSCGIVAADHRVLCWGNGAVSPPSTFSFTAIAAGNSFTCGIVENGNFSIYCWGNEQSLGHTGRFLSLAGFALPGICTPKLCNSDSRYYLTLTVNGSSSVCANAFDHVCMPCRKGCPAGYVETRKCFTNGNNICSQPGSSTIPSPAPSLFSSPYASPGSVESHTTSAAGRSPSLSPSVRALSPSMPPPLPSTSLSFASAPVVVTKHRRRRQGRIVNAIIGFVIGLFSGLIIFSLFLLAFCKRN